MVMVAVAAPAVLDHDSYPLSTYPVYAGARPGQADLATAVGVTAVGTRTRLSLPAIGASDDPLIVEQRVADAIGQGRAGYLCTAVADRARARATVQQARDGPGEAEPVVAIEVVTERVDLVATAATGAPPLERTVHARCPVAP